MTIIIHMEHPEIYVRPMELPGPDGPVECKRLEQVDPNTGIRVITVMPPEAAQKLVAKLEGRDIVVASAGAVPNSG